MCSLSHPCVDMTMQFRLGTSEIYRLIFYHKHLAGVKELFASPSLLQVIFIWPYITISTQST